MINQSKGFTITFFMLERGSRLKRFELRTGSLLSGTCFPPSEIDLSKSIILSFRRSQN